MYTKFVTPALLAAALFTTTQARAADYVIDAGHSSVSFTVRHMMSKVHGNFRKFTGEFSYDAKDLKKASGKVEVDAASIDTNVEKRDNHLRSADFFDVEKFKTLSFVIKSVESAGSGLKIKGDLTIHGVTKPVTFEAVALGESKDPWGNKTTSFSASTKVNRKDFGLNWNKALEAGGFLVGDEVEIEIDVEANPKPAAK